MIFALVRIKCVLEMDPSNSMQFEFNPRPRVSRSNTFTIKSSQQIKPDQRYFVLSQNDLEKSQYIAKRRKACQRFNSASTFPSKNVYKIVSKTISTQTLPVTEHKSVNTDENYDSIPVPEFMTPSFGPQTGTYTLKNKFFIFHKKKIATTVWEGI